MAVQRLYCGAQQHTVTHFRTSAAYMVSASVPGRFGTDCGWDSGPEPQNGRIDEHFRNLSVSDLTLLPVCKVLLKFLKAKFIFSLSVISIFSKSDFLVVFKPSHFNGFV